MYVPKKLLLPLLIFVVLLLSGIVGYMVLEGWGLLDSLYMTIITLSTVGYGEVHNVGPGGRIFTVLLIIFGVSIITYIVSLVVETLVAGEIKSALGRRKVDKKVKSLKDHYIICGYGRIGSIICKGLSSRSIPLVVIERDEQVREELEQDGILYLEGDATNEETLLEAGIESAKGLVSVVSLDAENLYICLSTWNARIQTQLLRMGFTIWFDPEGGKKERFGIRYPMKSIDFSKSGIPRGEMPDGGVPGGEYPGRPEDVAREEMEEEHRIKPEMIRELLVRVRDSMELLGPGNDEHIGTEMYIEDAAMIGVEAMMDISNGRLVYELKVPLPRREDIPYTIGAAAGAEIGIGFELGKMERPAMPAEGMGPGGGMPGGGMPGGGMPGGGMPGGGMPGGGTPGGGPPGGGRGDRPEGSKSQPSFDIWTKVRLAHETEGISQGIKTSQ